MATITSWDEPAEGRVITSWDEPADAGGGRGGQGGPTAAQSNEMYRRQETERRLATEAEERRKREARIETLDNNLAVLSGFSNAATFGLGNKISAAIRSPFQEGNFADNYNANVAQGEAIKERSMNDYPLSYITSNIAGATPQALVTGGMSAWPMIAANTGIALAHGAGQPARNVEEQLGEMAKSGAAGFALSTIAPLARWAAPSQAKQLATRLEELARAKTSDATAKLRELYNMTTPTKGDVARLRDMAKTSAEALRNEQPPEAVKYFAERLPGPGPITQVKQAAKNLGAAALPAAGGNFQPAIAAVLKPALDVGRTVAGRAIDPVATMTTPGLAGITSDLLSEYEGPLASARRLARERLGR